MQQQLTSLALTNTQLVEKFNQAGLAVEAKDKAVGEAETRAAAAVAPAGRGGAGGERQGAKQGS